VEGVEAVFPSRTPGALARILHDAKAIRISLEPLDAADQPGQITEVFTQSTTLHDDRMRPVMIDSHMVLYSYPWSDTLILSREIQGGRDFFPHAREKRGKIYYFQRSISMMPTLAA